MRINQENRKTSQLKLIFLSLLASNSSLGDSGDNEYTRATLEGLRGVFPLIEQLKPEIERDGLNRSQLREDTEKALRYAGVRVLSEKEYFEDERRPLFIVSPHILKIESELIRATILYIFNINIEFSQLVYLSTPLI